jgi:catechol 2,3-dioxygenase-like lactoylglutathione lyase family enzyme
MTKTVLFWRDLISLRLVVGLGHQKYRHYFFEVSEHDFLAFFEWPDVMPVEEKDHGVPVKGRVAFDHLSLGVENQDDLWRLKEKLEAAGFWASEVIDHGFIHSLYSFDPNGIAIEFSYQVPGANPRETPKIEHRAETEVSKEGPEPQEGKWPAVIEPIPPEEQVVYPGEGVELFRTIDY